MTPERIAELRALSKQGLTAQTDLATAVPELLDTIERLRGLLELSRDEANNPYALAHFYENPDICRTKAGPEHCPRCAIDKELTKETP